MIPSVLSTQLLQGVKDFLTTTFPSTTPLFHEAIDKFVEQDGMLFKGPYISVALPFQKAQGQKRFFPEILKSSFVPYFHQEKAFERLSAQPPKPTLVATGTGSGKTESFMYPILDYCRQNKNRKGIKAIIIYPMNALATDQAKRFAKTIAEAEVLEGVRVGLFIGDKEDIPQKQMSAEYVITDKDTLRQNPPDILLTNYKMLDFLLMRPKDQKIWKHNIGTGVLKFLAVDEIHTFDGAQGSDLASLLRRLRAKLQIERDDLACIGTSATLGSEGSQAIRDFASTVFNEAFDEASVIVEHRLSANAFLADTENDFLNFPASVQIEALQYQTYQDMRSYIRAQYFLWFDEEIEDVEDLAFRLRLGKDLKELSLFKLLIRSLDGEIIPKQRLIEIFKRRIASRVSDQYFHALIDSLLALTSWARSMPADGYVTPFLYVRVQLWLREMSRMVGSLEKSPEIKFSHDIGIDEPVKHYPVIHCRDCHAMGWGGVKKEGNSELLSDLDLFYQTFFDHDPRLKFIFPVDEDFETKEGRVYYIDPRTGMEIVDKAERGNGIRVFEPNNLNQYHKSHNDCPFCGNANALTILGSRAASLTSVLIGQSFASNYNDDKKMIAFSDSVQDAAHRAGFFGARSFQFTLRSAMQQALLAEEGDVDMTEFSKVVKKYWYERLKNKEAYVAMLIAPDMEWLRDYEELQQNGKLPGDSDIVKWVDERLDWSVYSEYGYKSAIGRTLEHSAASVAYVEGVAAVTEEVLPKIRNDIELLRDIYPDALFRFIYGFLMHLKSIGAIYSRHLEAYVKSGGETYPINRQMPYMMYMPGMGPYVRTPLFLTTGNIKAFEKLHHKSRSSWYDQWILDNFLDDNIFISGYAELVYKEIIAMLQKHKILTEKEYMGSPLWGINPEKMKITADVASFRCDLCNDPLTVAQKDIHVVNDMCCLRKSCRGHYRQVQMRNDYYKNLYSYGDMQRIVAQEHTGLLSRDQREWVEKSFIDRKPDEYWKPNLLSATPTLEMGIDIGDLSSVMLCSVPPNGANYLQRIGRAGRSDGNAFNATIANARNHDLYFYADPAAMMQGVIEAPGVFIDASAILQRQFTAFCIDQWVSANSGKEDLIPYRLVTVLESIEYQKKEQFPFTLIDYIQEHCDSLLETFFALYSGELETNTKEQLKIFALGNFDEVKKREEPDELKEAVSLAYKILNRLDLIQKERKALKRDIRTLQKKMKELQSKEAKDKDHEDQIRELEAELSGLKSILREIRRRDTFEFFTNEGLLPNYAFPESGVVLKSVIYRKKRKSQDEQGQKYESITYEYERSGSSAISELAPTNNFYAGGRKVRVDQINMEISEVETWRFCDQCSYSARESADLPPECPKCGSHMWSDTQQKRELLRMRQVMANTYDRDSRLKDDSEQREPAFFVKQLLVQFEQEQIQDAYATESEEVPFGFEFIQKVQFREINFGKSSLAGEEVSIAGKRMPRNGFVVCKHCGKVQDKKPTDTRFKPKHAFSCSAGDPQSPDNFIESLYLYREFSSEAIRLLLPVTTMAISDVKLHSLIAAFQMGLKLYFKGSVEHLRVTVYDEVEKDEHYKRRYLILFDTVPGGTGYLRQLMRSEKPLFEVLELAYQKLNSCSCNREHNKDGCYKCLYAYKNNFDRPLISRDKAKEIIKEILSHQKSVQKISSVKQINVGKLIDSELEERFLVAIGNYKKGPVQAKLKKVLSTQQKKSGYAVEIGEYSYEVIPQVSLGEKDGVSVASIADFVFYPKRNHKLKPIVVFTDGYAFHQDRLDTDSAQRMALVQSGKYIVWSLTWEDVNQYAEKDPQYEYLNLLDAPYLNIKMFEHISQDRKFVKQTSFEWLMELLSEGDPDIWQQRAMHASVAMLSTPGVPERTLLEKKISEEMQDLLEKNDEISIYGKSGTKHIDLFAFGNLNQLNQKELSNIQALIYLDDQRMTLGEWAGVLRLYNLFQFLRCSCFTVASGIAKNIYDQIPFENIESTEVVSVDWEGVYEEVIDEAKSLVQYLARTSVPVPEVGYEICNDKGVVVVEGELVWPELKVAVVIDESDKDVTVEGWQLFSVTERDQIVENILQKADQ